MECRRYVVCGLSLVLLLITGCKYIRADTQADSRDETSTLLVGAFRSRMRPAEARALLVLDGTDCKWTVLDKASVPRGEGQAELRTLTVSIETFVDLGVSGELRLEFYDEQLAATWFYPVDPDAYLLAAERRNGIVLGSASGAMGARSAKYSNHTAVTARDDYRGRHYVRYEDSQLVDWARSIIRRHQ